jgi:anti-sigma B factor antagonist
LITDTVRSGRSRIVVDLSTCEFVDSSGLGALIAGLKTARQAGGDLRIAGVGPQIATALRLTNLDRVLRAHDTVSGALSAG